MTGFARVNAGPSIPADSVQFANGVGGKGNHMLSRCGKFQRYEAAVTACTTCSTLTTRVPFRLVDLEAARVVPRSYTKKRG
jgi:hypothetical protein